MLHLSTFAILATTLFGATQAAPVQIERRIDQIISQSTSLWQQACEKAGGTRDQCSNIAVPAFTSLLEAGGVCDQQNSADSMINFAKQLGNDPEMIRLAQIFVQQPRNSPTSLQVPYCQVAPKNKELNGLFHCQFSGSDLTKFTGDQTGNVPLGLTALNPAGSCPANPDGTVPAGVQLNTLVQSPIAAGSTVATAPANSTVTTSLGGSGGQGPAAPPVQTASVSSTGTTNSGSSCLTSP